MKRAFIIYLTLGLVCEGMAQAPATRIDIYPDSVLSDVSRRPIGINLDFFMDDDSYLHPRRRLADALKAMGVKYLRYPGGDKSDLYLFSRPPYDHSLPTLARTGKDAVSGRNRALDSTATGFKNDVLDFDEFMDLCREVGAEPVIVVAADEYLVHYPAGSTWSTREQLLTNAVEWVRYANVKKQYHIKYWLIANESWNKENENSNADIYAQDVLDFSKAMKAVDPSIQIVPNGNTDDWWKTVLTKDAGHIDALCLSNYPVYNLPNGFASYRDSIIDLMGPVNTALRAIYKYAAPGDRDRLQVIAAEYGPFDWGNKWPFINNMGYNLANFELTGEQLKQPRLAFSCFWNTRWIENDEDKHSVFDALDKNGDFNANGYGLMIWGKFLGRQMVQSSASVHVRSFASYTPEDRSLFVYLVNKGAEAAAADLRVASHVVAGVKQAWELTGTGPDDLHPVWKEAKDTGLHVWISGTSIKVIEYKLQ